MEQEKEKKEQEENTEDKKTVEDEPKEKMFTQTEVNELIETALAQKTEELNLLSNKIKNIELDKELNLNSIILSDVQKEALIKLIDLNDENYVSNGIALAKKIFVPEISLIEETNNQSNNEYDNSLLEERF